MNHFYPSYIILFFFFNESNNYQRKSNHTQGNIIHDKNKNKNKKLSKKASLNIKTIKLPVKLKFTISNKITWWKRIYTRSYDLMSTMRHNMYLLVNSRGCKFLSWAESKSQIILRVLGYGKINNIFTIGLTSVFINNFMFSKLKKNKGKHVW